MSTSEDYRPTKTAEEIRREREGEKRRKSEWEKKRKEKVDEEKQLPPDFYVPDNDANNCDD